MKRRIKSGAVADSQGHGIHADIVLVVRGILLFISCGPFLRAIEAEILIRIEGSFRFSGILPDVELFCLAIANRVIHVDTISVRMAKIWDRNLVQCII